MKQPYSRRVAESTKGQIRISTVFLGLNHNFGTGPPILFETMVFGGEHDTRMKRYSTWEDAERGHKEVCMEVFGDKFVEEMLSKKEVTETIDLNKPKRMLRIE